VPAIFRAFAHRGGSQERPENSLAAFVHAVELGYVDLETDVRGTRDGVAVVHHDATLNRTTDAGGRLMDLAWSTIRGARIHGVEPIARIEELFEQFPDRHVTVDAKDDAAADALVAAIDRTRRHHAITLTSFSGTRLARMHRLTGLPVAASPSEVMRLWRDQRRGKLTAGSAPFAAVPTRVGRVQIATEEFVEHAHRCGVSVYFWTINDPGQVQKLIDLGADGIMTDRPTMLREVLRNNNLWTSH